MRQPLRARLFIVWSAGGPATINILFTWWLVAKMRIRRCPCISENMFEGREHTDGYLFSIGLSASLFFRRFDPCAAFHV
jgi:hypothetical protein